VREQRLQFGPEQQGAVAKLGKEKRLHTQPVAGEEKAVAIRVVDGQREHAVQPLQAIRSPLPPRGQDGLRVAVGLEDVSLLLEAGTHLLVIVDLAVEGNHHAPVGRHHRLGAALQIDDRQAPMPEAHARPGPHAAPVGAAMGKHVGHRLDPLGIDGLGHVDVEDSGDAAHGLFAARRAIGECVDGAECGHEGVDRCARRAGARLRGGRDQHRHRVL
jgi:hypothetical protein